MYTTLCTVSQCRMDHYFFVKQLLIRILQEKKPNFVRSICQNASILNSSFKETTLPGSLDKNVLCDQVIFLKNNKVCKYNKKVFSEGGVFFVMVLMEHPVHVLAATAAKLENSKCILGAYVHKQSFL